MSRQAATCSKHLFQTCTQAATADRAAVVAMLESRGQLKWLHPPQLAAFQAVQLLRQQQHAQQQQQDLPPDLAAAEAAGSPTGPVQPPAPELQQLTADLDNTFQVIQRWSAELRAQPGASSSSSRGQAGSTAAAHGQCIGCSTRRRRLQRHAGASHSFAEAGGHDDEALTFAADHLACWDGAAARLLDDMHGCGWCGRVALGGPHSQIRRTMVARASGDMPPAVLANPMLIDLASANTNCNDPDEGAAAAAADRITAEEAGGTGRAAAAAMSRPRNAGAAAYADDSMDSDEPSSSSSGAAAASGSRGLAQEC